MLFNKCHLCSTNSSRAQSEIRNILKSNNIKYDLDVLDNNRMLRAGVSVRSGYKTPTTYQFTVKKKDHESASNLIKSIRLRD